MNHKEMLAKEKSMAKNHPYLSGSLHGDELKKALLAFCEREDLIGVQCRRAYEIFCAWCEDNEMHPPHINYFSAMAKVVFDIDGKNIGYNGCTKKTFVEKGLGDYKRKRK